AAGDGNLSLPDGSGTADITHNASVLSVSVTPAGPRLHVSYVFGSDEYGTGAAQADRPGIFVGSSARTCTRVPDTDLFVSSLSVSPTASPTFFAGLTSGGATVTGMDGVTVPLTCTATVTPGVPVTIKLGVADISDTQFDSGLVLPNGAITTDLGPTA